MATTTKTPPMSPVNSDSGDDFASGFLSFGKRKSMPTKTSAAGGGKEWPSMNLLGALTRRKSARTFSLTRSKSQVRSLAWDGKQTKWDTAGEATTAGNVGRRTAAEYEKKLAGMAEQIADLELRVASRDEVLRRRAVTIQELEDALEDANVRVEELDERVRELQMLNEHLAETQKERVDQLNTEIAEKDNAVALSESEVRRVLFEHRPRPVQRAVRTLICAGTGAMIALASVRPE